MSLYLADRIEKPSYFKVAPLKSGRPKRRPYVIGFDSEAERGFPFLYQFAHPDGHVDLIDVEKKKYRGLTAFAEYVFDNCKRKDVEYIIFGFNLSYEWTQLFGDVDDELKDDDEISLDVILSSRDDTKLHFAAMNNKRFFATIEVGETKRRIRVIDARAYFTTSLNAAGQIVGAGTKKDKPKVFSRKARRDADFIEYARQDAILTQKIGEYIIDLHEKYDVATCVSAPHFAARTFRRHYLRSEIEPPSPDLEQYGLYSYHGGKNGYYLPKPRLLKKIYKYDIRSAYPEAMRQLPDIERGEWHYASKYVAASHSVWRVAVVYTGCKYRAAQSISGQWYDVAGRFETYMTGYEIDAALALGEFTIEHAEGYVFDGPVGGPLVRYVDDFYAMKRYANTPAEKIAAKLFLNSLYGKFFQKVPKDKDKIDVVDLETGKYVSTSGDLEYDFVAGGLYHPPIASLITGYVRAKMHLLEHKYEALMTSTDGIFAYQPPDPADIGDELGMLDTEIGELRIWRERLYVFTPSDHGKETAAFHGFRGNIAQLRTMPLIGGLRFEYAASQLITLRLSQRNVRDAQSFRAGEIVELPFVLDLSKGKSNAPGP